MIPFNCANCGKGLKAKEKQAGRNAKCPNCGAVVAIPAAKATLDEVGEAFWGQRPTLEELAHATRRKPGASPSDQSAPAAQGLAPVCRSPSTRASHHAYHPAGRKTHKWALPLIAVVILGIGGGIAWKFDLLSHAGGWAGGTAGLSFMELKQKLVNPTTGGGYYTCEVEAGRITKDMIAIVRERLGRPYKEQALGSDYYMYYYVREGTAQIVLAYSSLSGEALGVKAINLL